MGQRDRTETPEALEVRGGRMGCGRDVRVFTFVHNEIASRQIMYIHTCFRPSGKINCYYQYYIYIYIYW